MTRGCGRTGMSAGVRKGAKWVGDCGWLFLGRGGILKRSSIVSETGKSYIAFMACMLWHLQFCGEEYSGKFAVFEIFLFRKERKLGKGGESRTVNGEMSKCRNVEMSQEDERWESSLWSLSHLTVLHILLFFSTTLYISPCHRIHVRT